MIVQIHLQQNRNDLALKEVSAARRWAQDSLLVNLAEAWLGLRLVRWDVPCLCLGLYHDANLGGDLFRGGRNISRRSTYLKSWHKHRRHPLYGVLYPKQWLNYTLDGRKRHKLRWTRR